MVVFVVDMGFTDVEGMRNLVTATKRKKLRIHRGKKIGNQ